MCRVRRSTHDMKPNCKLYWFTTSVRRISLTTSRTLVLLVTSTVHTWGLPMNVSAYGCWEEICDPNVLIYLDPKTYNVHIQISSETHFFHLRSCIPVSSWAFLCRNHCCLMNAVGQSVAEGTHSQELLLQWEPDPRRGNRGQQTPEWKAERRHVKL